MRLVVDTNVLVSAFLWQGTPGRLIELAGEKELTLYTSRTLVDELAEVLHRQRLSKQVAATGLTAVQMIANYRRLATNPIPHLTSPLKGEEQEGEYLTLTTALSSFIRRKLNETVPPEVWEKIELPPHLHMNYRVVDDAGQELAQGRNLAELKQKLGQAAQMTFTQGAATPFDREGITQWDFGDLPEKVSFNRGNQTLTGYPALVDEGENVSIHLFDTPQAANKSMRGGVRRLLMLALKEQIKQLEKNIPNFNQLALQARNIMAPDALKTDLLIAIADRAFIGEDELPRDEKSFIKQRDRARARLTAVAQGATRIAADIFTEYHALQGPLAQKMSHPLQTDLQTQLTHLIYPHFLSQTPWEHLQHIPRYLKAIQRRLEKRLNNAERDGKHMASVRELWQQYEARVEKHRKAGVQDEKLSAFRWMLEELRVSLFAQELKTPYPVSYKRLAKAWEEVAP